MKRNKASIKRIYAQSWKCCLCDRKLFSFEAIPEVYSPKQECFCARCFVENNPKLAKKIAGIVDRKGTEERDEFLHMTKAERGTLIWMIGIAIVFIVFYLKSEGAF